MSNRTVIVSGGSLNEKLSLSILQGEECGYIIGVDRGLAFLYQHHIDPDYIVGDFDSLAPEILEYYKTRKEIPIREFNPVKDASDTEIAIRLAIESGKKNLTILGATGTRIDHIWANVQSLKVARDAGAEAEILDEHNRIRLIHGRTVLKKEKAFGPYFSIFPLGGEIDGLSIRGAKYPLYHHRLTPYDSLCVSNQIQGEEAVIDFQGGLVVLMETRD
ncbi:MAG: thiamine diphosphokinase [Hespellia sp.]|nr:thiamine diphosphokinase [Hespellia sp.]